MPSQTPSLQANRSEKSACSRRCPSTTRRLSSESLHIGTHHARTVLFRQFAPRPSHQTVRRCPDLPPLTLDNDPLASRLDTLMTAYFETARPATSLKVQPGRFCRTDIDFWIQVHRSARPCVMAVYVITRCGERCSSTLPRLLQCPTPSDRPLGGLSMVQAVPAGRPFFAHQIRPHLLGWPKQKNTHLPCGRRPSSPPYPTFGVRAERQGVMLDIPGGSLSPKGQRTKVDRREAPFASKLTPPLTAFQEIST